MDRRQTKQLNRAIRVHEYSVAHSDGGAASTAIVAGLGKAIGDAQNLARQQRDGQNEERNAADTKKALKKTFRKLVRHVARVAALVAKDHPELTREFRLPRGKGGEQAVLTAVRSIADEARANQDLFLTNGMAVTLIADMDKALADYEAAIERTGAAKRAHIGANAEVDAVLRRIMLIVRLLDGLNQYRFEDDAEKLAAWNSARNLPGPGPEKAPAEDGPVPPGDGTVPRAA